MCTGIEVHVKDDAQYNHQGEDTGRDGFRLFRGGLEDAEQTVHGDDDAGHHGKAESYPGETFG